MSCQRLRHQTHFLKCPSKARATPLRRDSIRQPIEARKRSTRRATDETEPRDSFQNYKLGAKVAKHGSRSVSSLCDSADVIEAMGISVDLGAAGVTKCVDEAGVGFMFAPNFL